MKIAIFHELDYGGARRAANEIAKNLTHHDTVDLYFVEEEENKKEKEFFSKTFFYKFVPKKWSGNNWRIKLYKDTVELYNLYQLHKKIAKDIHAKKYDVVFVHPSQFTQAPFLLRFIQRPKAYYCQEPFRLAYDPAVVSINSVPLVKKPYEILIRSIRKYIDKINIDSVDNVLTNSHFSKSAILQAYNKNAKVCYLGIDINLFLPIKIKKNYDLLFIGDRSGRSGYGLLQEIIPLIDKKLHIRTFLRNEEKVSDQKLVQIYNSTKIVLALSRNEPFGFIPLEAMACEIPVIAINEGGFKETIIDGKTGYLVDPDPPLIAKKIEWLLGNKKIMYKLGKQGRKDVIARWAWEKTTKNLKTYLQKVKDKNF